MEQTTSLFGLGIDTIARNHLSEAARWAKFLAVCGFILIGLMVLYGMAMVMFFTQLPDYDDSYRTNETKSLLGIITSVIFAACILLAFFPYLFLLKFANKMKRALESDDQSELNASFMNLKIPYRYMGILTIISLAFIVLSLITMFSTMLTMA
jgi:hypothetical protein